MSGAAYQPITWEDHHWIVGEHRVWRHTVLDDDGVVQDITGWQLQCVLRRDPSDTTALLTLTVGNSGVVVNDAVNGVVSWQVTAAQTTTLGWGRLYYSLHRTDTNAQAVVAYGPAYIGQAASR